MPHPLGGIIFLDKSSNKSVGSNVEEVVQWDQELCVTKTFTTAVLIFSSHRFD
jgi:hypothetical protein